MQALLSNKNKKHFYTRGFTIVEVVVVATVMGALTTLVLFGLGDYYSSNITSLKKATQDTKALSVLNTLESDLAGTSSWISSLAVDKPLGPANSVVTDESWSFCGLAGISQCSQQVNRVLITYMTASDKSFDDATRLPIFANKSGSCDFTKPVKVARIYFVAQDNTDSSSYNLYRRTITNPDKYTTCNGKVPFQKTTCASSVATQPNCLDAGGASHTDALLLKGIKLFNVDYFTLASDISPIPNVYTASSSTIAQAMAMRITITTEERVDGKITQKTDSIRIAR